MTRPYLVSCDVRAPRTDGTTFNQPCLVATGGESEDDAMANARAALRKSFTATPDDGFLGMKAELLPGNKS